MLADELYTSGRSADGTTSGRARKQVQRLGINDKPESPKRKKPRNSGRGDRSSHADRGLLHGKDVEWKASRSVEARPSRIHGVGLFCTQHIAANEVVGYIGGTLRDLSEEAGRLRAKKGTV